MSAAEGEPLGGPGTRVLAYPAAFAAARRQFLARATLDMEALADELAVSRATLYRVVGSRERLLGEVVWHLGARTLERAVRETDPALRGADRVVEVSRRFNAYVVSFAPLRTFIRDEPVTAFHVLFMPTGQVHDRSVAAWRGLVEEAVERGEVTPPFDVDRLAYVLVRIGESMLYADLLSGREPDIELAAMLQRAVFDLAP